MAEREDVRELAARGVLRAWAVDASVSTVSRAVAIVIAGGELRTISSGLANGASRAARVIHVVVMRVSALKLLALAVLAWCSVARAEDGAHDGMAEEAAIAEELAFGATVVELDEKNFEHLTQAATGATSGDWLVLFCKDSVPRCQKVTQNWQRVAVTLAASREAKGLPRINVAQVDTSASSWLRKRFDIQSVPVVLLFKGGVMYSFHGGGFSVERLVAFAERDFERSNRMLVPPEPHVATPHDQTFLITIGTVAAGASVLYVVDLLLGRYYWYQSQKKKKAKKAAEAAKKAEAAPKGA